MAIVLIAIGLLFTGVDFMVGSGISYPDFIQPTGLYHGIDIHPRIQQYVTQNILGHNLQVDILPDVIGCLLVLIGAFMFVKHNKKFWFGVLLAILAGGCSIALRVIPFYVNGGALILSALSLYFLAFVFEIWMEYIMIYVTVNVSDDMANVSTNRRMQFGWWVTVFARIFIFLLTFVGIGSVRHVYEAAVLLFTVFYLYQLVQTRKYVGTYKVYKEGFNSAVLPEYVKEKMIGVSYRENPDISLDELRYVRIIHYDFQGQIQEGELVVDASHLMILTSKEQMETADGQAIGKISVIDAISLIDENHFDAITTLPKVDASVSFVSSGEGRTAIITKLENAYQGIKERIGTIIK